MSKFRIYTEQTFYGRQERLAILIEGVNGVTQVAEPLAFKDVGDGATVEPFTFEQAIRTENIDGRGDRHFSTLDGRALIQAFMDHGWAIGLRPTGVFDADTTKQIAALKDHLADFRALVFKGKVEAKP